jgi:PD-(D/E)XK endonuclease
MWPRFLFEGKSQSSETIDGEPMRKNRGSEITNSKQRGEWAQLCFMARAAEIGLTLTQPYGDSSSYDVGIEDKGRLLRIQVKSSIFCRNKSFSCTLVGSSHERYPSGTIDFFAIYLIPIDLWYIIPFEETYGTSLLFTPGFKGHKHERFREAWHLLRSAKNAKDH